MFLVFLAPEVVLIVSNRVSLTLIYLTVAVQVHDSQAFKEKPLLLWLLIKAEGEVLCTHCTCMADFDEAYSHIGAVHPTNSVMRHRVVQVFVTNSVQQ